LNFNAPFSFDFVGDEQFYASAKTALRKKAKKRTVGSDDEEAEASPSGLEQNEDLDDFSINDLNKVSENELQAKIAAIEAQINSDKRRDEKRVEKEKKVRLKQEREVIEEPKIPALKALSGKKKANAENDEEVKVAA
jgi:transcription factor SPN1